MDIRIHVLDCAREAREADEGGGRRSNYYIQQRSKVVREREGCREQILTLALVGQTLMKRRRKGMLAAFIDFNKDYDRVDCGKLWGCLERAGLRGRMVNLIRAAYMESKCEVNVSDLMNESINMVP